MFRKIFLTFRLGVYSLLLHKLRAFLAVLGILIGIATFGLVLGIGIIVHPLLRWLHLARVPRLSLLLIVVILTLLSAEQARVHFVSGATWSATMPVVITAAIVEQFWAHWEQGRLADALKMTAWTGLITAVTSLMLHMYPIQLLVVRAPVGLALIGGGICLLLGRYRGLRLVELWRFRSLRRHAATNETSAVLKLLL
mgnify:CR=1 FL=1